MSERLPRAGQPDDTGHWAPGPAQPRIAAGAAHVWRADLATVGDELACALSAEERERAAGILDERERARWQRSRGVLRELLARYTRDEAAAVELALGLNAKPQLADAEGQTPTLFFNLSHSGWLALYAFSASSPLGIDVQVARNRRADSAVDHIALARRAFGEHEAQRLSLVAPARREWEFLRAWVRYEAELKRRGTGLGAERGDREVSGTDPSQAPAIVELDVGPEAAAALALSDRASELRRWDFA
jgi:4'-phosphopantetheinyl transferase